MSIQLSEPALTLLGEIFQLARKGRPLSVRDLVRNDSIPVSRLFEHGLIERQSMRAGLVVRTTPNGDLVLRENRKTRS